jgi:hypothetical protein
MIYIQNFGKWPFQNIKTVPREIGFEMNETASDWVQ